MKPTVLQLHYHGRTGGVKSVMNHVASALLQSGFSPYIIVGEPLEKIARSEDKAFECPVGVCPGLAYHSTSKEAPHPKELADSLEEQAEKLVGRQPDVWYFHNHSLGKNVALPGAVYELARRGHRLLLQIHDFAEDGRPQNYARMVDHSTQGDEQLLSRMLYPQAAQIHYAVINKRDMSILSCAGLNTERLHYLPNCIASNVTVNTIPSYPKEPSNAERPLFLYPTRAIERKNIGELLLWAAIEKDRAQFGITRAPMNEEQHKLYESWKKCAQQYQLPLHFEMGQQASFMSLAKQSTAFITTSVAEGFGLCYLEPWLWNRPLVGRRLGKITEGISDAGLSLDHLYDKLLVPLKWIGKQRLYEQIREHLTASLSAYGQKCDKSCVDRAFSAATSGKSVDFGRLDPTSQKKVIELCAENSQVCKQVKPCSILDLSCNLSLNKKIVQDKFSMSSYSESIATVVKKLLSSQIESVPSVKETLKARGTFSPSSVLGSFLQPENFWLIRSGYGNQG